MTLLKGQLVIYKPRTLRSACTEPNISNVIKPTYQRKEYSKGETRFFHCDHNLVKSIEVTILSVFLCSRVVIKDCEC